MEKSSKVNQITADLSTTSVFELTIKGVVVTNSVGTDAKRAEKSPSDSADAVDTAQTVANTAEEAAKKTAKVATNAAEDVQTKHNYQ